MGFQGTFRVDKGAFSLSNLAYIFSLSNLASTSSLSSLAGASSLSSLTLLIFLD